LTETIGSSFRMYYESMNAQPSEVFSQPSQVAAAVAHCPWDAPLPRQWAARKVNLQHFTEFPRGGHFTAWEEPELVAADIHDFVRQLR
jgi:pimeloyl-ACP methyl ester carboxylesterase